MENLSTVLLVDDDTISNYITQELLQDKLLCTHVAVVTDGRQALRFLQENQQNRASSFPTTLVLLDLNMPVMDGFEFMEELQTLDLSKQVVVAVLTSSDNYKDIARAQQFTFAAYLEKPVAIDAIKTLIAEHFS